ncbi:MAG: hypothetical protein ABS99_02840 [Acetobacteraceae bacterium SCN 69-10]|nr:acyltransferase [Rhodospirillales bacterium]ODU60488.1 MAG: hypothetical protein ABS99_02840 [Acetobacteraceae bacterium SCN 69-10]OJY77451.1 MAG: hypothetical protein BGP12_02685 [Rhodospirillales bacterium 70-18]
MTTKRTRIEELDVFRGLASASVLLFHYIVRYPQLYPRAHTSAGWERVIAAASALTTADIGVLAVYVFFVISGFVIVWTVDRCRTWQDFVVSRFSRLYPTYWTAMLLTTAVGVLAPLPGQHYPASMVMANLTMLQGVANIPDVDGVYWSLFVELVFYVMIALIFVAGQMHRIHEICLLWLLIGISSFVLVTHGVGVPWRIQKYLLLHYAHFLISGIMLYQLWTGRRVLFSYIVLGLCVCSFMAAYPWNDALVCAGVLVLFGLALGGWLRWISVPPLRWLGAISYALYVIHQMIGYRIIRTAEAYGVSQVAAFLLATAAALAIASAITYLIERPAMRAIRGAWRTRQAVAVQGSAG